MTISITDLVSRAKKHHWKVASVTIEKDSCQEWDLYKNPLSVLDEKFRTGDSGWSLFPDDPDKTTLFERLSNMNKEECDDLFNTYDIPR